MPQKAAKSPKNWKQKQKALGAVLAEYSPDFIMSLDGRSRESREFRARFQFAVECMGGANRLGYTAMQMKERMIFMETIVGRMESALAANDPRISYGQYVNASNSLQGMYLKLGLNIGAPLPRDMEIPALMENRLDKMFAQDKRDMSPEQRAEDQEYERQVREAKQRKRTEAVARAAKERTGVRATRWNNSYLAAAHIGRELHAMKATLSGELADKARTQLKRDRRRLRRARKKLLAMHATEASLPVVEEFIGSLTVLRKRHGGAI